MAESSFQIGQNVGHYRIIDKTALATRTKCTGQTHGNGAICEQADGRYLPI